MDFFNASGQKVDPITGNLIPSVPVSPIVAVNPTEELLQQLLFRLTPTSVANAPIVGPVVTEAEVDLSKLVADKIEPIVTNLHNRLDLLEQRTFGTGPNPFVDFLKSL